MKDKRDDDFFEEDSTAKENEQKLIELVDSHSMHPATGRLKKGSAVKGRVVRIGEEFVFLDVGAKNEAVMKTAELLDENGRLRVKAGDEVSAYVVSDAHGELIVSTSLGGGGEASVSELAEAMRQLIPVEGKVIAVAKAGLTVRLLGRRAFCPISQVEIKHVEDVNSYLNRTMKFIIARVEERGRNVVLTRIPLLEQELQQRLDELAACVESKTPVQGKISRIVPFGLFVDLGMVEGLVHISEISWDRIEKPDSLYAVGQPVTCLVLAVEKKEPLRDSRISLSIRRAEGDPWETVPTSFAVGTTCEGTVTRCTDYGAFVRIAPGVEGLVHISEMSWSKKIRHPTDVVQPGQTVRVRVLEIDAEKKSVSLTLKDNASDPWNSVSQRFIRGATVTGIVTRETRYGYFVELSEGVTGLLLHVNIAPERKNSVSVNAAVEVTVENVDTEKRRISLSCGMAQQALKTHEIEEFLQKQEEDTINVPVSEFGALLKAAIDRKK